jgi:uncharacterized membrane protein (UPF0127 family)
MQLKKTIIISSLILLAMLVVVLLVWPDKAGGSRWAKVILPDMAELIVEVADTQAKQMKGLSDREDLDEYEGMLFVYETTEIRSMWMQDMLFSIDVIWLNQGKIVQIDPDLGRVNNGIVVQKESESAVDMFLELEAGQAEELKLKLGDKLDIVFIQ